jgi:hypothetical protein
LNWLAELHADREDFAAAKVARREALEILRKCYGETHWKVTDARLALKDVERRAGMTHDQKKKWTKADRLNAELGIIRKYWASASPTTPPAWTDPADRSGTAWR